MMSKKKKEKTHEPTKTKTKRSSRKASQEDAIVIDGAPTATMGSLAPPKLRSIVGGKKRAAAAFGFSTHDIALRAYYIAERRRNLDLAGDELGDWIEAERQLRTEARRKSA
jgi:hypothetical protein